MNRRELLLGLGAALAAAKIPIPAELEVYGRSPSMMVLPSLTQLQIMQRELLNRIINPPYILHENGTIEQLSTETQVEALRHVNALITELRA